MRRFRERFQIIYISAEDIVHRNLKNAKKHYSIKVQ